MKSDIEIAQKSKIKKIIDIARSLGIPESFIENYGHFKAKIDLNYLESIKDREDGKLILVTSINPTPAGEGKTTSSIGLGDALNSIGEKTIICLREPSLGPVFGLKGGATGGGYSQIIPMEDINLHFTGDFSAIALANNLLAAMIDNHIHHGNKLDIDPRRVTFKRVVDLNDRALRKITIGQGGLSNGFLREEGFDIVVASEVMAIFCLSNSILDLKEKLGNIVFGYTRSNKPLMAKDINAHGAMTVLLKNALKPNLVQTLENNPAIVHGGPFANIAHGCNSIIATKAALKLSKYVVTEAGFGADLGAEKFIHIKCRNNGLKVSACVIIATIRALKYHGGLGLTELNKENLNALKKGLLNLERHINNVTNHFGLNTIVSINRFIFDTDKEITFLVNHIKNLGVNVVLSTNWAEGSFGAKKLAHEILKLSEKITSQNFVYEQNDELIEKIIKITTKIYGASDINLPKKIKQKLDKFQIEGYGKFPICIAKTQSSFSSDSKLLGAPINHTIMIKDVKLNAGAKFIVVLCGEVLTMPGLPKIPSAEKINIDENKKIVGLF